MGPEIAPIEVGFWSQFGFAFFCAAVGLLFVGVLFVVTFPLDRNGKNGD